MARPVWNGTISFGLVSIPIKLFHAVSKKNVSFNQLDERDNSRIRYKKVSAATEEEVPDEHIVKGYEVSKGNYVIVDPDELEPFLPTATRAIELEEFVDLHEIDPVFFDSPYYVAPDKQAKPYVLLTRAMEEAGKVAIGRFVMRNKQYVAALRPVDGRLMMSTMVFADEVVDPTRIDEFDGLDDVDVSAREVQMAEQLVESLAAAFEPDKFRDTYREQVLDLIEKKAAGEAFEVPEQVAEAPKVVDLMAALEASVQAAKDARGRHPAAQKPQVVKAKRASKAAQADEADEEEARPAKRARARKSA